jgi:trans-2-enoyl-CoA reductase
MFETLAKLVNADKLRLAYTEYELCDEFAEALEHAQARAQGEMLFGLRRGDSY